MFLYIMEKKNTEEIVWRSKWWFCGSYHQKVVNRVGEEMLG